jgi:hypothetical protein
VNELLKQVISRFETGPQESQTVYVQQPEPRTESDRTWFVAGMVTAGAICVGLFGLALCAFTEKE